VRQAGACGRPGVNLGFAHEHGCRDCTGLEKLPLEDARAVADWLQDYLDERWDKQLETDAAAGRLDKVWEKTKADIVSGNTKPLEEVLNDV
jgi:hypothetical protein